MCTPETLQTIDVEFSADSVETCPLNDEIVACGTYQLLPDEVDKEGQRLNANQKRIGRIYFYSHSNANRSLEEWARVDTNAVLDMKWANQEHNEKFLLAVADAMGELSLYARNNSIALNSKLRTNEDQALVLSLDWSDRLDKCDPHILTSLSNGHVQLYTFTESTMEAVQDWKAHDFEAWICAFNCWNNHVMLSGGDDCLLKCWDRRVDVSCGPLWTNKRHEMGVTSLQWHPRREFLFASGSYDETVRVWDSRSMKQPVAEYGTGGGVWRLKWHPRSGDQLLAACMYNGFHILDFQSESGVPSNLAVQQSYSSHESIAYGVDWIHGETERVASCSFYDHRLDLWEIG